MMGRVDDIANKITVLYLIHFGNRHPGSVTCKDCLDYCAGFCSGGADDVMDCLYDKVESCEFLF